MSVHFRNPIISGLLHEYDPVSTRFGKDELSVMAGDNIVGTGLFVSREVVHLRSISSIIIEAPGCVAAPVVTMVATNAIRLGTDAREVCNPVRLYAPDQLSIRAGVCSIGDVVLLEEPANASIFCNKIQLLQFTDEEPWHFEVVKSWIRNDDTEVETIDRFW